LKEELNVTPRITLASRLSYLPTVIGGISTSCHVRHLSTASLNNSNGNLVDVANELARSENLVDSLTPISNPLSFFGLISLFQMELEYQKVALMNIGGMNEPDEQHVEDFISSFLKQQQFTHGDANPNSPIVAVVESSSSLPRSPLAFLDAEIAECLRGKVRLWQNVLYASYPNLSALWHVLDKRARDEIFMRYLSLWNTVMVAFPLQTALKVQKWLREGELRLARVGNGIGATDSLAGSGNWNGNGGSVRYDESTQKFRVLLKYFSADSNTNNGIGNELEMECSFRFVINGTGSGQNVLKTQSKLLRSLLVKDAIISCEFGGVELDFETLQPIAKGGVGNENDAYVTHGLYFCGDSTNFGTCFTTSDISQLKVMVNRIVVSLFASGFNSDLYI
jgi:hypothetical protein